MRKHTFRSITLVLLVAMFVMTGFLTAPAQAATSSPATTPCNRAEFVADVTVKDNTVFEPGATFTKTWRFKNTGSCNWSENYILVFIGGTSLSKRTEVRIKEVVKPGKTVDVSVKMTAPTKVGTYTSYWMMKADNGKRFGFGANADKSVWVTIKVGQPPKTVFNFADRYCKAIWRNGSVGIPCNGAVDNPAGYVSKVGSPKLENGLLASGATLVVHPQWVEFGEVRGRYENIKVQKGDRFQAAIACMDGESACDVTFELRYRVPGQRTQTLASWRQTYDGKIRNLDVDLSSMAGKKVTFFLVVRDNGNAEDAYAAWVNPRIVH